MPTTPPTISAAPAAPQRSVKATFSDRLDAFVTWLVVAVSQFIALATNVYNNAVETFDNATTASNAATAATDAAASAIATANVTVWVSGATVQKYANVISPINHLTYRRKTATGSGTTDPSLDTTNYMPLLSALTLTFVSAEQVFTAGGSLTIAHGLGAIPKFVMLFGRDTSTSRIYQLATVAYAPYVSGSPPPAGAGVSYDATNIYVSFASNPVVPNGVYFVKAFV